MELRKLYKTISALSCFSKIIERIMFSRLYKYLTDNNILYKKQSGFQEGHSTEHMITQQVDQINHNFEKDQYTLGVFIKLSKAFDTVYHKILIAKIKNYGNKGINLFWFKKYQQNCKQFMQYDISSTSYKSIICNVSQDSILDPLLLLNCINDFQEASNILDSSMFVDETKSFLFSSEHKQSFFPQ